MPDATEYFVFNARVSALNIGDSTIPLTADRIRQRIDEVYEQSTIIRHHWRVLMEATALLQARCVMLRPDGWRLVPTVSRNYGNARNK